jgi:hypothetical protein
MTPSGSPKVVLIERRSQHGRRADDFRPANPTTESQVAAWPVAVSGQKSGGDRIAQAVLLVVLFVAPAMMALHAACVVDPDAWWHLRTAEWIVQHHALPHVDAFSTFGAGKPWAAYSWLFELILYTLFKGFGLSGIVAYTSGMILAITVALHHMIQRRQDHADFSFTAALAFVGCFSLAHLYTPRSWLFTILFFVVELDILMHARRTGKVQELKWLPVLFALWANLHIQFLDGLFVLGLAAAGSIVASLSEEHPIRVSARWMCGTFAASVLATLLNPYGWHIYGIAHELAAQPGVMNKISELQSIPFRDLSDFLVLGFALAAVAVLAAYRKVRGFETLLLVFAILVSFRSQRDVWVVVAVGSAIIAGAFSGSKKAESQLARYTPSLAALAAALILFVGFRAMHIDNTRLAGLLDEKMPVKAVAFVQERHLAGPVYNDFGWGGYLMWSMRMPVSIDGRAAFQGDARIDRSEATWAAKPGWDTDPALASSGIVIGRTDSALVQVLKMDPRFHLAYQDKVATVFVAQQAWMQSKLELLEEIAS